MEWNVKSKVGSLQNSSYKPGGGDKKIETVKLDFKEKAKPKVASTANLNHKPGGGAVKVCSLYLLIDISTITYFRHYSQDISRTYELQ